MAALVRRPRRASVAGHDARATLLLTEPQDTIGMHVKGFDVRHLPVDPCEVSGREHANPQNPERGDTICIKGINVFFLGAEDVKRSIRQHHPASHPIVDGLPDHLLQLRIVRHCRKARELQRDAGQSREKYFGGSDNRHLLQQGLQHDAHTPGEAEVADAEGDATGTSIDNDVNVARVVHVNADLDVRVGVMGDLDGTEFWRVLPERELRELRILESRRKHFAQALLEISVHILCQRRVGLRPQPR
mmetsp:Transcript_32059/g.92659  ORF Transcript_32059/g.92659 Transcript_32059/m.92659 type:complete len:246 (-) Transcript_32059:208-945(-)